jgi:hypothetical protein
MLDARTLDLQFQSTAAQGTVETFLAFRWALWNLEVEEMAGLIGAKRRAAGHVGAVGVDSSNTENKRNAASTQPGRRVGQIILLFSSCS